MKIIFPDGWPTELKIQKAPIARADSGNVVLSLAVAATNALDRTENVEMVLERAFAEEMAASLSAALRKLA